MIFSWDEFCVWSSAGPQGCFPGDCVQYSISSNKFIFWSNYSLYYFQLKNLHYPNWLITFSPLQLSKLASWIFPCLECTFFFFFNRIYLWKFHFPRTLSLISSKSMLTLFTLAPVTFFFPFLKMLFGTYHNLPRFTVMCHIFLGLYYMASKAFKDTVVGWMVPPKRYIYILIPGNSECDLIWKKSFSKVIKLRILG